MINNLYMNFFQTLFLYIDTQIHLLTPALYVSASLCLSLSLSLSPLRFLGLLFTHNANIRCIMYVCVCVYSIYTISLLFFSYQIKSIEEKKIFLPTSYIIGGSNKQETHLGPTIGNFFLSCISGDILFI